MSKQFFRSNRPGYPHPVSSELENSGTRVAVSDCSITELRRLRPPYQTGKTVHVHAKHYKHNEDGRTVLGVCDNGSVPLSHSGNVLTRIGIHTHKRLLLLNQWTDFEIIWFQWYSGERPRAIMALLFVKFHHDTPNSKGTRGQKPFFVHLQVP